MDLISRFGCFTQCAKCNTKQKIPPIICTLFTGLSGEEGTYHLTGSFSYVHFCKKAFNPFVDSAGASPKSTGPSAWYKNEGKRILWQKLIYDREFP